MQYLTDAGEIERAIAKFAIASTLWLDTEIADYQDKNLARVSLIQVLDNSTDIRGDRAIILDVLDQPELVDLFIEKIIFNPQIEKVFHKADYDIGFLGGKRRAQNITCTLKLVQSIPYYLVPLPNHRLGTLAEYLCYFPPVDKSLQSSDWGGRPLTPEQLEYAKMDVVYLAAVHHRLLQLQQLAHPNPKQEDIIKLGDRYRQIERDWKLLNTEVEHLKQRIKEAMRVQGVEELDGFKLSVNNRTTKTVSLQDLLDALKTEKVDPKISIKLTKELENQLKQVIDLLEVESETKSYATLRVVDQDISDIPF